MLLNLEISVILILRNSDQIFSKGSFPDSMVSLFLDVSKVFDTVNHLILLEKLKYYGLYQREVNWFRSYLRCNK